MSKACFDLYTIPNNGENKSWTIRKIQEKQLFKVTENRFDEKLTPSKLMTLRPQMFNLKLASPEDLLNGQLDKQCCSLST